MLSNIIDAKTGGGYTVSFEAFILARGISGAGTKGSNLKKVLDFHRSVLRSFIKIQTDTLIRLLHYTYR